MVLASIEVVTCSLTSNMKRHMQLEIKHVSDILSLSPVLLPAGSLSPVLTNKEAPALELDSEKAKAETFFENCKVDELDIESVVVARRLAKQHL